jgi:ribosomal subunit interface protein
MNTHIKATAIEISPSLSEYLNKHIAKIENILDADESVKCDVEVGRTTAHHNKGVVFHAELHIVGKKYDIFARADRDDILVAVDEAFADALYSLTSRRKKYMAIARRGGARVKSLIRSAWPWGND